MICPLMKIALLLSLVFSIQLIIRLWCGMPGKKLLKLLISMHFNYSNFQCSKVFCNPVFCKMEQMTRNAGGVKWVESAWIKIRVKKTNWAYQTRLRVLMSDWQVMKPVSYLLQNSPSTHRRAHQLIGSNQLWGINTQNQLQRLSVPNILGHPASSHNYSPYCP